MTNIEIAGHRIGTGERAFVIAEIGVNHDGDLERAIELVRHAHRAGADAVKIQLFRAAKLMHRSARFAEYQVSRVDVQTPEEMLAQYELSPLDTAAIVAEIASLEMVPLATPFSPDDVATIDGLGLPAVKIASPDLVNRPLLERAASLGRPMIVSTGAATLEEVGRAVSWLREWDVPFALLHCISAYPVASGSAKLCWIAEMAERFDVAVGYSDHTTELLAGAIAVAAGACAIEKHLTYDRAASGPDHSASADPRQFADYVRLIRSAEELLGASDESSGGGGGKRVLDCEQDVRHASRQSLVLCRDVVAGEAVTDADLTVQRPGTGISAAEVQYAVGRRARQPLAAGTMLQWDMLVGDAA